MPNQKTLKMIGYVLFATLALGTSLYLTFPGLAVSQRLANEIRLRSQGRWTATFDDVTPYRLTGLAARGVRIKYNSGDGQPVEFSADKVSARLRILPLLLLRMSFRVEATFGAGAIGAVLRSTPDHLDLDLEIDSLDLASPPNLAKFLELPVVGKLNGRATVVLAKDYRQTNGTANLTLESGRVGPGSVYGFTLPPVSLGHVNLGLELTGGRLNVTAFDQQGGDLKMRLSGSGVLRADAAASSLDMCAAVRVEPALLKDNPRLKTALELAEVRVTKDPEGFLNIPFAGPFNALNLRTGLCHAGK